MNADKPAIRLLLVDDHEVYRTGLRALLGPTDGFRIVGEAKNGMEALELIDALAPDVALLDLTMPKLGGLEVIEEVVRSRKLTRILVLSFHDEPERVALVKRAGAGGYLCKSASAAEIFEVIQRVAQGEICFPPCPEDESIELSPREKEVAILWAQGFTEQETADILKIGIKTENTYRANIRRKWNVSTTAEVITQVKIRGWLDGNGSSSG